MYAMDSSGHDRTRFLSIGDVADRTSLSQRTIRRYVEAGSLPARKAGSRILIRESDLDVWFSSLALCGTASEPLTTTATSIPAREYRW